MNPLTINRVASKPTRIRVSILLFGFVLAFASLTPISAVRADDTSPSLPSAAPAQPPPSKVASFFHKVGFYSSKNGPVHREYTLADRVRYQLWDYTWKPDPNEPISRIEVRIGEQRVYVYQGDNIAAESPITTGKPGHDTPTGHYSVLVKDIDHKSNLYGVFVDSNGYIVNDNANASDKAPPGSVYDSADMPYYLRIRDDGVGMHGGYLPGYPASHGCIRLPHAFAELLFSNVSVGTPVDVVP